MATDEEIEKLITTISKLRTDEYHPWRYLFFSFLNAIVRGAGQVIGMTIVLAGIIFIITKILSQFVDFPLIGNYIAQILNLLDTYLKAGRHLKTH